MYNLDYKFKFFCMFLSFHDNKNWSVVSPNEFTKWKQKKNLKKNLGDIKCVEVKFFFLYKTFEKCID